MGTLRLLDQEQEKGAALSYLCGIRAEDVAAAYGISPATLTQSIVGKRAQTWGDPLVDFYRGTSSHQRSRNAAHLYLSANDREVPNNEFVSRIPSSLLTEIIGTIFDPQIEDIVRKTNLDFFVGTSNAYQALMSAIFGSPSAESHIQIPLLDTLEERYNASDSISLPQVFVGIEQKVLESIK
tara:strand:+ start:3291 stop:3836 length:546 start_codon:yes stop_codon:yes gene_type:complete